MGPNVVTVKIEGLADLERRLYELPTRLAKNVMRRALRAAGGIWRKEIRDRAPRLTGWLIKQITMTTKISARYDQGVVQVGPRMKQDPSRHTKTVPSAGNVAFWYEFGTARQPARPFMRPAFDATKDRVLAKFAEIMRQGLDEAERNR